jgi:hypothetical protein
MRLGLGLSLEDSALLWRGPTVPEGPTLGPELWPQPDFDGSDGLTLLNCSISGGELVFNADDNGVARCSVTSPPAMAEGEQYAYSLEVTSFASGGGTFRLFLGGGFVDINDVGTFAGIHTLPATPIPAIRINDSLGVTVAHITSCSIKKVL